MALVSPRGESLGVLPPIPVAPQLVEADVAPVVAGVRAAYGIEVTVLRVLWARAERQGGTLRYLAEYDGPALEGLTPLDEPRRAPWARAGGHVEPLRWATAALAAHGRPPLGPPAQQRAWCLSAIWRFETAGGPAWLKQVPAFFAHEGPVLRWLEQAAPGLGPTVLAAQGDRVLMDHVPGEDCHDAPLPARQAMLADLLRLQSTAAAHLPDLLALGVPDRRAAALAARVEATAGRWSRAVHADRAALDALVDGLSARLAAVADCGIPDTLVHGDFHAGNVRADGERRTIIDWADCLLGHPALDLAAFLDRVEPATQEALRDQWATYWRTAVPGCDPDRAAALMAPVAALHQATIYDAFLLAVEPAEHPYFAGGPPAWLHRATTAAP